MKLLILTQYYPPETGAPQNRLHDLAKRLKQKGVDVTVLTAMPNYPANEVHKGYEGKFTYTEIIDNVRVLRSWIYVTKSKSVVSRLLNYFSFVFTSFWVGLFKVGKQDYILCESPPLFLGKTAFWLCLFKGSKLIFNVSDLWPESAEKLGVVKNRLFLRMAGWLEAFMYKRSWLITGQTQGIVASISKRFSKKKVYWLPNGVDVDFFNQPVSGQRFRTELGISSSSKVFVYAGLFGYAQGLEVILKAAKELKSETEIHFVLAGTGPEKDTLVGYQKEHGLQQVHFLDVIKREEIPVLISEATAAIIPLKKIDLFKGAIPSKLFEPLAIGVPILLGVEGEAKDLFVEKGGGGLAFEPENEKELVERIKELVGQPDLIKQLGENGRAYVAEHFNRQKIADNFYDLLN